MGRSFKWTKCIIQQIYLSNYSVQRVYISVFHEQHEWTLHKVDTFDLNAFADIAKYRLSMVDTNTQCSDHARRSSCKSEYRQLLQTIMTRCYFREMNCCKGENRWQKKTTEENVHYYLSRRLDRFGLPLIIRPFPNWMCVELRIYLDRKQRDEIDDDR